MHTTIDQLMKMLKGKVMNWLLAAAGLLAGSAAEAQNLNNPNKMGPLGTQVNTFSGNLFIPRTDFYIPARGFNLNVRFYYNSYHFLKNEGYGRGWSFEYNIRYKDDTIPGRKIIIWSDGREDRYDSLSNGTYRSPRGFFDRLRQYGPGKFVLVRKDSTRYFFDNNSHRRLTRMEAPNGNFLQFQYTNDLLTAVVNGDGQTISFAYDGRGQLTSIVDAVESPARTYMYRYDAAGNLTEVQDPAGGKWTYTYLVNGPMKTLADKNSNKIDIIYFPDLSTRELIGCNKRISFSYDTAQKKTVVTDYLDGGANQVTSYTYQKLDNLVWITSVKGNCCGFEMQYDYDDQGNIVRQTDANGNASTFTYDDRGNLLTATDPLGQTTTYTYSASFNQITSMRDVRGQVFTLKYDAAGHLTELTEPGNRVYTAVYNNRGDLLSSKDPMGNEYTYHYDNYGHPIKVTGPNGYTATLGYDARGNLLSFVDANGNHHSAEYDILDRLKKVTNPLNRSAQFAWDAQSNLVSVTNSNNETVQLGYDASNRLVRAKGPTGNTAELYYDAADNIIGKKNSLGHQWQYAYDNRNRLQQINDALGNLTNLQYDANGNLTQATLANGHTVSYTYDKMDRLLTVKDGESELAAFTYDASGNIIAAKNPAGGVSSYRYDELGRVVQVTDPLGNSTAYTYDKNNNQLTTTDANGHTSYFTYDSLNRLKTYTDNNGFVMTIGYDARGNVTSLTDQNGNKTNYTYNALNQRKSMTLPDGSYQEYGYDNKGNLVSQRLADGSIINYQYDTLSRIVGKTLPGGDVFTYRYDKLGRIVEATNKNGTIKLTYDALNRITSETFDGRTTTYQYNVAGRTHTTVYPDGSVVVREFDGRNRPVRITKDSLLIAAYDYNTGNQMTRKTFGNGVMTQLQTDFAYRLNSLSTAGGAIQNTQFAYDKTRNKTAINRLANTSQSESFTYDNGYRLTQYKRGSAQSSYTYDAVGNRTAENINGTASTFTANGLNQLTAKNGKPFTYDGRGNLIYDGTFYKTYDAENRLVKDSASPTSVITYGYDAFGRRVMKTVNGQAFNYTYSGLAPIEERVGDAVLNSTVFAHFLTPVMNEKSGAGKFYFHQNEANSVEAITNSNGRLVESYRYDAYGKLSRFDSLQQPLLSSLAGNRFGFTGQEWDSATNSYRFFYRNYNPETGTFNQRDLIEYGDGMSMYQYLGNNPANGIDILGLNDPCKPKPTFEQIRQEQSIYLALTQLGLDYNGNVGTMLSVVDLPRAMAEASYRAQYLKAASQYAEFGEAVFESSELAGTGSKFSNAAAKMPGITKTTAALGKLGPALGALDLGVKGANLYQTANDPAANSLDVIDATGDVVQSGGNLGATVATGAALMAGSTIAAPAAVAVGTLAVADAGLTYVTGKGVKAHSYDMQYEMMWGSSEAEHEYYNWLEAFGLEDSEFLKNIYMQGKGDTYLRTIRGMGPKPPCPPPGGTLDPPPFPPGGPNGWFWLLMPMDPNEIIGPEGVGEKKFVSAKDRMPYTILCENDKSASAPAKYIRISTPIEPKQDAKTFQLGSFGFNNLNFSVPEGLSSYYTRLDLRDSLGLYVDVVAGYDQIRNEAFWEFQSIDPVTLLPTEEPLKGLLSLQDSTRPEDGHGFVTYSIRPVETARTGDTIGARAKIVFDQNDTIPTNIYTNTLDAVAPQSRMTAATFSADGFVNLEWTGRDDAGGSGVKHYSLYVSTDGVNYSLLVPETKRTDTTFLLQGKATYCFFVLATDSTGNVEVLNNANIVCASGGTTLPVTWLTFSGKNINKDNLLEWSTATEQNSKEFKVQRSLNGTSFTSIGTVAAAGNSNSARIYRYTDRNIDKLNSAVMYYRLQQVDKDGKTLLSNVVRLTYQASHKQPSIVYPNPTRGLITVTIGDRALLNTNASLFDQSGKLLQVVRITAQSQSFDLSKYVSGTYYIRLQNKEVMKVVKQ